MAIRIEGEFGERRLVATQVSSRPATAWLSNKCIAALSRKAEHITKQEMDATSSSWIARLLVFCVPHRRAAHSAAVAKRSKEIFATLIERHISSALALTASDFLSNPTWRELRHEIIRRDGRVCQEVGCGLRITGVDLQIDHIKPRSVFPELSLDPSNLRVLCRDCNFRKGARFRPEEQRAFHWETTDAPVSQERSAVSSKPATIANRSEPQCSEIANDELPKIVERGRYYRENNFKSVGDWEDRMVKEFGQNVMKLLPEIWKILT